MALVGNTIRLKFSFKTFDGIYADPEEIILRVKDINRVQLVETMINKSSKTDLGRYVYEYTIPEGWHPLVFEVSAILEGSPIVDRYVIPREWIKS